MDTFVERFQPDLYEDWKKGIDKVPHPEEMIENRNKEKPKEWVYKFFVSWVENLNIEVVAG